MLSRRVVTCMLGVDGARVRLEGAELVDGELLVRLRPKARWQQRCPRCDLRCGRYDPGRERRWRALDAGRVMVFVVARVPRVRCPKHGVLVAGVPWARHGARHTHSFEQLAAWCAVEMTSKAASALLRCSWRTIGVMVARVAADATDGLDVLDGVGRIGVDEISYRRGKKYLLVVVDHDRRRLIWASKGATKESLDGFFTALGPERAAQLTHVSCDGMDWLNKALRAAAPNAVICADPFHVVKWAMKALDLVRRQVWNDVRRREGQRPGEQDGKHATGETKNLKDSRWALWKNPERLTQEQRAQLAYIAAIHPVMFRAYRLKEALRLVFTLTGDAAITALKKWRTWARRSGLKPFIALAERISRYWEQIIATLTHGVTNALVESVNTKIRLITRRGFGFRNTDALIGLAKLSLGGYRPQLPT